jgi:hypothetical protein
MNTEQTQPPAELANCLDLTRRSKELEADLAYLRSIMADIARVVDP